MVKNVTYSSIKCKTAVIVLRAFQVLLPIQRPLGYTEMLCQPIKDYQSKDISTKIIHVFTFIENLLCKDVTSVVLL